MRRFALILSTVAAGLWGCARNTGPDDPAKVEGRVLKLEDSAAIAGANVVLYDADANAPVARASTDADGRFSFEVRAGNYFLSVTAQGRIPSPPPRGRPAAFQADAGQTVSRTLFLDRDPSAASTGGITGKIDVAGSSALAGVLVVAVLEGGSHSASTTTGPDGVFALFNLPPGTYALQAFRSGLAQDGAAGAQVQAGSLTGNVTVRLTVAAGSSVSGKISFLAAANGNVDITLIHPSTRDAIPGLSTRNDANNDYVLRAIPPGSYIAWASFQNDGYVMDPDRIHKFGLPRLSVPPDTTLPFEVTDAVTLVGPTNPADDLYPATVATSTPTFRWAKYPSAKEYIVEVFNAKGARIWGGADSLGNILHPAVSDDSARFSFDGSAREALKDGGIYSWKVYADNDAEAGVQGLISSSEDLRGLFQIDLP